MSKAFSAVLTLAIALTASVGSATASETAGVSIEKESSSSYSDILKKTSVTYFSIVHGTPLSDISSPYALDHNGKKTKSSFNAINLDNDVTAAYMLNSDVGIGPYVPFILVPVQGQGLVLGDVGIKTFNKHLISYNGLNISGNLYLQAPTAKASRNRGMDFGVKSTPAVRYAIPSTRFAIGTWNEAKWYSGVVSGKTFKLYTQPYVNYALTSSLALNLGYEIETDHMQGNSNLNFTTYQTDLLPGVVWFITPKVMVNPYLQIFTGNKISTDTTALGAVINASIL